jgi:hypothetical protein
MITQEDQLNLFKIIAQNLKRDITCYAFGGTAMMFYGYKDETKDIDFLFEHEEDRKEFIRSIEELGFEETSAMTIYIPEKLRDKHRPLMFKNDTTRFDLFVNKIFRTIISPQMKEDLFAVHDFKDKHKLRINVLRKEHIVMLKGVTERDKDFEDILTIVNKDKNFNWQYLIDEVIWQHDNGDTWVLYDVEEVLKELKEYIYLESKYLKQLYKVKPREKKNTNKKKKTKKKK